MAVGDPDTRRQAASIRTTGRRHDRRRGTSPVVPLSRPCHRACQLVRPSTHGSRTVAADCACADDAPDDEATLPGWFGPSRLPRPGKASVVNRLAVPLTAALLVSSMTVPPAAAVSTGTALTAWLATNGAATLSMPSAGRGTIKVRLVGLTPRTTYRVVLERGTCAPVGNTRWLSLPALRTSAAGAVSRSVALTSAQAAQARSYVRSGLVIRVGSLCGRFITPLATMTLRAGDAYFTIGGRQQVVFMRNLTAYWQTDFNTLLGLTKAGGSRLMRVNLELGFGDTTVITPAGAVDEAWAQKWEQVFDEAAAAGIHVIVGFASWFTWNDGTPDLDYSRWKDNPLNKANGGPAATPGELFVPGSTTQRLWLDWVKALVHRWRDRTNIAAWEIFSEVNIASGVTESSGVAFVDAAAAAVRSADPLHRAVTASLAGVPNGWTTLLRDPALDFNQVHPYPPSARLDTTIIAEVRQGLADDGKPLLIGESGLNASPPDGSTLETAPRAAVGVRHAIWAGLVSGAMDARALWWQDSVGIYLPNLGMPYVRTYATAELPASRFAASIDVAGFAPLAAQASSGVVGAALGSATRAIGWFRDAACEPPDWPVRPIAAGQTVTLTVPGSAARWHVDFIDTATGTRIVGSEVATRQGDSVTVTLPAFTDDIAFRMVPVP